MKTYGIILASGYGERFGGDLPKQFTLINGKTILEHTLDAFEQNHKIDGIILVITPEFIDKAKEITLPHYKKVLKILKGGDTRKESSKIAVNSIDDDEAKILIHDCARPFVTQKIINDCVGALDKFNAVCTAIPSTDTILNVQDGIIESVPPRKNMWQAQTPQCFKLSLMKKAHELAQNDNCFTDDCGLIIKYKLTDIHIVEGDRSNIKITYPQDITKFNH